LVKRLSNEGYKTVQLGGAAETAIAGAVKLDTPSIRYAAAVQKFSTLFIGGDSIFNHTSQAVGTRSVILWGSTHPCGSGYDQNINLVNGQVWTREMDNAGPTMPCQPCYREFNKMSVHPKPPCPHLVSHPLSPRPEEDYPPCTLNACMAANTVDLVWKFVKSLLS
jgi:hypothetical protein